jgi:Holliday junction resolvase-like predicted endonuclease
MDSRPALGRAGEDAAAAFYVRKGFTVVERNWRCSAGEIDLIVRRGSLLVFCEVKTRSSVTRGLPSEAVDQRKQARLDASRAGGWRSAVRAPATSASTSSRCRGTRRGFERPFFPTPSRGGGFTSI